MLPVSLTDTRTLGRLEAHSCVSNVDPLINININKVKIMTILPSVESIHVCMASFLSHTQRNTDLHQTSDLHEHKNFVRWCMPYKNRSTSCHPVALQSVDSFKSVLIAHVTTSYAMPFK